MFQPTTEIETQTSDRPAEVSYPQSLNTYLSLAQTKFYASDQCHTARGMLQDLVDSAEYETDSSYYSGGLKFCERHLDYLSRHPNLALSGYISNLKLMTRRRSS
jgi:hypothetical protein